MSQTNPLPRRLSAIRDVEAGVSPQVVAKRYLVSRATVHDWVKRYRDTGQVEPGSSGRPKGAGGYGSQIDRIAEMILTKKPNELNLSYRLWCRDAIQQLIESIEGKKPSRWTVNRQLCRWGFSQNVVSLGRSLGPHPHGSSAYWLSIKKTVVLTRSVWLLVASKHRGDWMFLSYFAEPSPSEVIDFFERAIAATDKHLRLTTVEPEQLRNPVISEWARCNLTRIDLNSIVA